MRRSSLLCAALIVAACGQKGGSLKKRDRDSGPAVVTVDRTASGAPIAPEKEPDDGAEVAQPIALPGGVRGKIDKAADVDLYTVKIEAPGTLALALSGVADADLVLAVQDTTGKKLAESDNGPAGTAEGIPNLTVQPGTYTVRVTEFVKPVPRPRNPKAKAKADAGPTGRQAPSAPYTLEATLGPPPGPSDESEPDNDAVAFAGTLAVGGTASAWIGWRRDRDVWKVPLVGVGDDDALSVDVDGVAGVALKVAILDGTEAVLLERVGRAGDALQLRNVAVRAGEPNYFVSISSGNNKANPIDKYTVRVASAPFQLDEEAEPNDNVKSAGPLSDVPGADSGTRVGFLVHGDVDVFKLEPAATPRLLQLTLEPPSSIDAVLSVIDSDGTPVVGSVDAGKAGGVEKLTDVTVPANTAVFVKVAAKSGESATDRYRLRWSAVVAEETAPIPGTEEP